MRAQPNMKPDLLSVVERYTHESASYGKAVRCPIHGERTPSLHLYEDQHWFCFGCGKGGDVYDFVGFLRYGDSWNSRNSEMFIAVAKELESSDLKTVLFDKFVEKQDKTLSEESAELLRWVCSTYHKTLLYSKSSDAEKARNYLSSRGYSMEVIKRLKVGYAGRDTILSKSCSLSKEQRKDYIEKFKKLGLIKENDSGVYEYYRNRIMFPNVTPEGNVINLTGRAVWNSNKRYLNIPEIKKDLYLIRMINPEFPVYLTESVTDTLSMWQLGFQTVATNGTALSKRMAASLEPFTDVRIVPQNDMPSVNAANKWAEILPKARIVLPEYIAGQQKDINDILMQEGEKRARAKINVAARKPMDIRTYTDLVTSKNN